VIEVNPNGTKTSAILGIDQVNLYYSKTVTLTRSVGISLIQNIESNNYNLFKRKESSVAVIPIRWVTKIESGMHKGRRIYICFNSAPTKQERVAFEVFDPKITQRIANKIKSLREHAIKKNIKHSFIG